MNLESGVLQIHIEDIIPNRFQPRLSFDEQALKELADSIREHGIIQPLVLRKLGDKYEIIAGERRYKAAQMAGLQTVPAVIANIDDNQSAEVALVENVQRKDLTAIEEARSYKSLLDKGYLTQEQLAKRMGLSQPAIANKLRLLNLDEEVQQALLDEKISERHARTLLTIPDKNTQRAWLHRIINERLTVRQLDLELKKANENKNLNLTESLNEDVPLVTNTPSIEEIKANAIDLNEARKMPESNVDTNQSSSSSALFTPATSVPSSATPEINDTLISPVNNDNNKYFDFSSTEKQAPNVTNPFNTLDLNNTSSTPGNLEIFDQPDFVSNPSSDQSESSQSSHNASSINPNQTPPGPTLFSSNKFFTPIPEQSNNTFTVPEKVEQEVDPMAAVDKISPVAELQKEYQEKMELKDAIATIRKCIEGLGDKGFYIEVEEIDFNTKYQITIQIDKN